MLRLLTLAAFLLPLRAHAQGISKYFECGGYFIGCGWINGGVTSTGAALAIAISLTILDFVAFVAVIAIIYGAFLLIAQRGDLEKAKATMKWAIVGFVCSQLAAVFINYVVDLVQTIGNG